MADKPSFEPFIAVDIGSFSFKFAYVTADAAGKPKLKIYSNMNIPPFTHHLTPEEREKMSREDVEKDALSKIQKFLTKPLIELVYDNQIQTKRAITLASGRPVTIRYFEVPPSPDKEMEKIAVQAEASKQMPFSMENAVLGYSILGDTTRGGRALSQMMVAALQKDVVTIISENLKGGSLSLEGILTLPQSLELGIPEQLGIGTGKDSKIAVIHVGHKTTSVMIYKNGKLHFYRDINMAGETITEAILAGGELDGSKIEIQKVEDAIELKHKIGVLPPDEIKTLSGAEKFAATQIFSIVEKIFQHIQLSISFYISQFQETGVEKLILCGGSAAMKNFKEFIQESLEVPVEYANPFAKISLEGINIPKEQLDLDAPALAPAIGLALYKAQHNIINFIDILFPNRSQQSVEFSKVTSKFGAGLGQRLQFDFKLDETKLKALAALIGILLVVLLSYPFVKIGQDIKKAGSEYKNLQNKFRGLNSTQNEVTQLLKDKATLGKEAGFFNEMESLKFPNSEMLLELASITPRQVFLSKMEFTHTGNNRTFQVAGQTDTSDRVFDYINAIKQSSFFKNPNLDSSDETPIDENRYFMKFAISGKIQAPTSP